MYSMARRMAEMSRPGGKGTAASKSAFRAIPVAFFWHEFRQYRNCSGRKIKVFFVDLQADALQSTRRRGGNCRTRTHEWVEYDSFPERQTGAYELTQKMLRLKCRVCGNLPFHTARRR